MALGTAALVLGGGLSDGIARQLTDNLVAVQTGHVQVVVRADDFVPQNSPFDAYGHALLPGGEALARASRIEAKDPACARAVPYPVRPRDRHRRQPLDPGQHRRHPARRRSRSCAPRTRSEAGAFLPARRPARRLRRGAGRAQAAPLRRRPGVVRDPDPAGRGELHRRGRVRRSSRKSAPWYDGTFYVPAGRRAGAVRPARRRHQREGDAGRRQQRGGARARPAVAIASVVGQPRRPRARRARAGRDLRRGGPLLVLDHPGQPRPRSPSCPPSCSWPPRWGS